MGGSQEGDPAAPLKRDLVIRPEAQEETAAAYQWYERQRCGLGDEFLGCVEAVIEQIRREPEMFPVVHRNVRRALTRRFPYGVYYFVEPERVVVVAVFHGRRNPQAWKSRR